MKKMDMRRVSLLLMLLLALCSLLAGCGGGGGGGGGGGNVNPNDITVSGVVYASNSTAAAGGLNGYIIYLNGSQVAVSQTVSGTVGSYTFVISSTQLAADPTVVVDNASGVQEESFQLNSSFETNSTAIDLNIPIVTGPPPAPVGF